MTYLAEYNAPIGKIEISSTDTHIIRLNIIELNSHDSIGDADWDSNDILGDMCITQLDEYFEGSRKVFELPILQLGTDFQKSVWCELNNIPYGETRTYSQIATNVGHPNAYRAVGSTNSKNKIPIIIPCHRVIGANGKLSGYAFGTDRKKWLIEHEKKYS